MVHVHLTLRAVTFIVRTVLDLLLTDGVNKVLIQNIKALTGMERIPERLIESKDSRLLYKCLTGRKCFNPRETEQYMYNRRVIKTCKVIQTLIF